MTSGAQTNADGQWHDRFTAPKSSAPCFSQTELLHVLQDKNKISGRDFLPIDVRRNDHENGTIQGSMNLPAQSLWYSLETLYTLCSGAGISLVIFYCGSSRGRGPRAASWFNDILMQHNDTTIHSVVLEDGFNGWLRAGEVYTELVSGYNKKV